MSSKPQQWVDLQEEHLQDWRQHPVTALLVGYLRDKSTEAADQSLSLTMMGQGSQSASRAGAAQTLRDIVSEILAKRAPKEQAATDTTWTDPAARRSKRENIDV